MSIFSLKSFLFLLQKRSASSVSASSSSFTVKYLVDSCGLPLQSAIAASRTLDLDESRVHRSDYVLNLLKSYGFNDTHFKMMFIKRPDLLYQADSDKFLKPKIQYLVENGFEGPDLHDLIAKNPRILLSGLDSRIKPLLQFLRESLGTDERAIAAFKAYPWLFTMPICWKHNVELLLKEGVAVDTLAKSMVSHGRSMVEKADAMRFAIGTAKKWGLRPADPKFLNGVLVLARYPLWERKVEVFKSFGWTEEETLSIFRRCPHCFDYSEKKLKSSMEFLVNTMKFKPEYLSGHLKLLGLSIEKRVRPRYNVLKLLLLNRLLKEEGSKLYTALNVTEAAFLKKYVNAHLHLIPSLLDAYHDTEGRLLVGEHAYIGEATSETHNIYG